MTASPTTPSWRRHEDALAEQIIALHDTAAQALGGQPNIGVRSRVLAADLTGALAAFTAWCVTAATNAPLPGAAGVEVRAILAELRRLGAMAAEHDFGLHTRRLLDISTALRRLNSVATSAQLVDLACDQLVSRCGFGRAVLSRVDSASWRPWTAHFVGADAGSSWFAAWVDHPIPLDDHVVEAGVLDERRPAAVLDTSQSRVYRPIIVDAGRSNSYVVAPVVLGDAVVGFFHADHAPAHRRSGLIDRDVLWAFAQGFGLAYEKLVLAERIQAQRDRLQAALGSAETLLTASTPTIDLATESDPGRRLLTADDTIPEQGSCAGLLEDEELTERERDVLRLLAVGATNAQVADELVVSENTVKSHVRHILRKLRVANRAQAVSRYLGVGALAS